MSYITAGSFARQSRCSEDLTCHTSEYRVRMTDYSPFQPRPTRQPPKLALARTLWTMTKAPSKRIEAAIYVTDVGRELRVTLGASELVESMLSRTGDPLLEQRADEIRRALEDKGWTG